MQLRRLVLPAPFGPMMALKAPGWTEKLTSWRAVTPPKRRTRWEMSRRGDDIRRKTTCLLYRGERSPLWPDPTPTPNPTHEAARARVPIPDPRLRGCLKTLRGYFFSSGAGAGVVPGAAASPPGAPGVAAGAAGVSVVLMLSVIITIVQ